MITEIEDFFSKGCGRCPRFATPECSTRQWAEGLAALRSICLEVGLVETVKWGHPCYMHAGKNIVVFGALREDFRISFFRAALMADPHQILERAGPNTRYPDLIRFRENADVTRLAATLRSYLREAMDYAEADLKPPKESEEIELPAELEAALAADPELATAFHALTPGRQRSYVINLNSATKTETRVARIAKFRNHILAGKGALDR